jgi:hypothetical protein
MAALLTVARGGGFADRSRRARALRGRREKQKPELATAPKEEMWR